MQSIQGFLTSTKYLQTNLFDIKVKEKSIPHEDNNATLERINTVRNPLFEVVEQQLQSERTTFVVQQTNLSSQFTVVIMHVPLAMVVVVTNVLRIPLPKFHDGNDAVIHIGRLAKVCVTNGEDTYVHKLQYFPTIL